MFSRAKVALLYLVLPACLALGIGHFLLGNDFVIRKIAAHRPLAYEVTLPTNVVRQIHALDARLRADPRHVPRIAVIGSSSVVNGIDIDLMEQIWREAGLHTEVVNAGMTGLVAYELPMLYHLFLHDSLSCAIYLHNRFSFGDRFLGTVIGARWNTQEMARINGLDGPLAEQAHRVATGFANENASLIKYALINRSVLARAIVGQADPTPYPYDFEPTADVYLAFSGDDVIVPDTDWLRSAYVASAQAGDTLGFRGLDRFLELASAADIEVMVAPVPEPDLVADNRYRRGLDFAQMDERVEQITADRTLRSGLLDRNSIAAMEEDPALFRDHTHFNRQGRHVYSERLAQHLMDFDECHF